jgi:hypothetical protein
MTEGVDNKVDFTTFAHLLGFGSGDRYADTIQTENVMNAEDIVFAYERRDLADGKTVGLKPFYYAMNNLFGETINPKGGVSTSLRKYAKNLLARMAPGSDAFSVSRFIWAELSDSLDDARNDLPYAPYIMYIIERVSGIEFKKDVEHNPYKLTQWQHTGWAALVGAAGTSAAAEARPTHRASSSRPSSSHHRSRGSKLKELVKNLFCMCQYDVDAAYEGRKDINDMKRQLGLEVREIPPPIVFPPFEDTSEEEEEMELPHDRETLAERMRTLRHERG